MNHLRWTIPLVFSAAQAHAQSFGPLVVAPTHPTPGLALSWATSPPGANTVLRWTDANPTPVMVAIGAGSVSYTDTTPAPNTIYYYQVTNASGSTNVFPGVVSDTTLPFNCPPLAQSPNLGMDRTESFTAADGTPVTFTVHVPVAKAPVANVTPCNGAGSCDDYANIHSAIQTIGSGGGGTVNLAAGDYYVNPGAAVAAIYMQSDAFANWNDVVLAGAGIDANSIPTTRIHVQKNAGANPAGLQFGSITRSLVRNISIDLDSPNAIPGTVKNVVQASFMGTVGTLAGSGNNWTGQLTVTGISGTISPSTSTYLYDTGGQLGSWAYVYSQASGPAGGNGVYNVQFPWGQGNSVATPIAMTTVTSQRFYVQAGNETYYVPNPASPPAPIRLSGYRLTNRTYDMRGGARSGADAGAFNPNFNTAGPDQNQYFWALPGGRNLPDGEQAVMFVGPGNEAAHVGVVAVDTTLENVHLYGGAATGIILHAVSQNLRLSNFKITHTPDSILRSGEKPRYVSVIGDSDENNALGNVIIENSEMAFVEDDSFYVRGPSQALSAVASTTSASVAMTFLPHPTPGGDIIRLIDQNTYAIIGTAPGVITSATCATTANPPSCAAIGATSGYAWTLTLNTAMPALAPYVGATGANLPVFGLPTQSGANLIVRNSCFHDNWGRIFPMAPNVLIQNNVFGNHYFSPIELSMNQTNPGGAEPSGPGPYNVTIAGNKFVGNQLGWTDRLDVWNPLSITFAGLQTGHLGAAINIYAVPTPGFYATGYPLQNIEIYNNFISNTPGLAVSVNSAANVGVVGNNIVDANSIPNLAGFNATYCGANSQPSQPSGANQPWCLAKMAAQGAIMVTRSRNVDTHGNTFLGTSSTSPSVYMDAGTVSPGNVLVGSQWH